MAGILGVGANEYSGAIKGMGTAAQLQTQRDNFNKESKQAYEQGKKASAISGATLGGYAGMKLAPLISSAPAPGSEAALTASENAWGQAGAIGDQAANLSSSMGVGDTAAAAAGDAAASTAGDAAATAAADAATTAAASTAAEAGTAAAAGAATAAGGAEAGAEAGAALGPWGMLAGAAIGGILGSLF